MMMLMMMRPRHRTGNVESFPGYFLSVLAMHSRLVRCDREESVSVYLYDLLPDLAIEADLRDDNAGKDNGNPRDNSVFDSASFTRANGAVLSVPSPGECILCKTQTAEAPVCRSNCQGWL